MYWIVALALILMVSVALLLLSADGRRLVWAAGSLLWSLLDLLRVCAWFGIRLVPALPAIAAAAAGAMVTIGKARLALARQLAAAKRMEAELRRAFGSFRLIKTVPGDRNEQLEAILQGIFLLEFPEATRLVGKRARCARIVIVADPDDAAASYGIVNVREAAVDPRLPLMETADLMDAVLADFAPKCGIGLKFRLTEGSGHEKMVYLEAIAQWLASKEEYRSLREKFGF